MRPLPSRVKAHRLDRQASFFHHELAPTESLLGRWSRFCLQHSLSAAEAVALLAPFSAKVSVLRQEIGVADPIRYGVTMDTANGQGRVGEALGLSTMELACATGGVLGHRTLCAHAFVPRLRWCPTCFASGFHSVVFQHRAMAKCPLHGQPLVEACPKCGHSHEPTYCTVARLPFACPKCREEWIPSGKLPDLAGDAALIGPMLEDRARELGITNRPQRKFVARSMGEALSGKEAPDVRSSARSLVWALGLSSYWPRFNVSTAFLNDWQVETKLGSKGAEQMAAVRDCLTWLEHVCGRPDECRDVRYPTGLLPPLKRPISVATVALHMTMARYTKQRLAEDAPRQTLLHVERVYDDVVWTGFQASCPVIESPTGNALIVRAEILSFFAVALLQAARRNYIDRNYWKENADLHNFSATSWVAEAGGGGHLLHFRPRATAQSVTRLLHRYRNEKVGAWPDHTPLGRARWYAIAPDEPALARHLGAGGASTASAKAMSAAHARN